MIVQCVKFKGLVFSTQLCSISFVEKRETGPEFSRAHVAIIAVIIIITAIIAVTAGKKVKLAVVVVWLPLRSYFPIRLSRRFEGRREIRGSSHS